MVVNDSILDYFLTGLGLTWTIGLPGSSHAEATLAGWSDVAIGLDFIVVKASIKLRASSTWEEDSFSGHLVWDSRAVEGSSATDDDGKQESKDSVLHGSKRSFQKEITLFCGVL